VPPCLKADKIPHLADMLHETISKIKTVFALAVMLVFYCIILRALSACFDETAAVVRMNLSWNWAVNTNRVLCPVLRFWAISNQKHYGCKNEGVPISFLKKLVSSKDFSFQPVTRRVKGYTRFVGKYVTGKNEGVPISFLKKLVSSKDFSFQDVKKNWKSRFAQKFGFFNKYW